MGEPPIKLKKVRSTLWEENILSRKGLDFWIEGSIAPAFLHVPLTLHSIALDGLLPVPIDRRKKNGST